MDTRVKYYPHPVLAYYNDDYVGVEFISSVTAVENEHMLELNLQVLTDDESLRGLVADGFASYGFHIECPQTYFRQLFRLSLEEGVFRVPLSKVDGVVSICPFIFAERRITSYRSSTFHPDYGASTFDIDKGMVLAVGESVKVVVDRADLTNVPSIVSIIRHHDKDEKLMSVNLDFDRIQIYLPETDYFRYKSLQYDIASQNIVHSAVIYPVLVYILEELRRVGADGLWEFEDRRWFRVINRSLKESGIDIYEGGLEDNTTLQLAQLLIDHPVSRAFKAMVDMEDTEEG